MRCFIEARAASQQGPRLQSWHEHLTAHDDNPSVENINLKHEIMEVENTSLTMLKNELLVNALKHEQECEIIEIETAKMLCLLAAFERHAGTKKANVVCFHPFIDGK